MARFRICALSLGILCFFLSNEHLSAKSKVEERNDVSDTNALRSAVYSPQPDYPYEARRRRISGAGVVILEIDRATGFVTHAHMDPSTGSSVLDDAALTTFGQWRFNPGIFSKIRIPITFSIETGRVQITYEKKAKSMDDVLASYLGKGTVLKGPIPDYPRRDWSFKKGKGVYELHGGVSGYIESVKILKSSGDPVFDRVAQKTLGKWRLSRGPLILELPLSFELTPESYKVQVAR